MSGYIYIFLTSLKQPKHGYLIVLYVSVTEMYSFRHVNSAGDPANSEHFVDIETRTWVQIRHRQDIVYHVKADNTT